MLGRMGGEGKRWVMKRTLQQLAERQPSRRTVLKAIGLGSGMVMLSAAGFADDALHSAPQQEDPLLTTLQLRGVYTLRQQSTGRFLDAHEIAQQDFAVVTRPPQNNASQRWTLTPVGTVFTMQQQSSGRFVDAHEIAQQDFAVVTRPPQNNATQRWAFMLVGNNTYTIQQLSTGRFVDAHEIAQQDFAVVTRPNQNNATQRWVITLL